MSVSLYTSPTRLTNTRVLRIIACAALCAAWTLGAAAQSDRERGEYVAIAGGCVACHSARAENAVLFAGGRALKTPFGTFYGPNITPHPESGIGRWSEADFVRAMREGKRPDGAHYYPAFPYTSYTRISNADLHALWSYLRSLPPNARKSQAHELKFPYNLRFLLWGWKLLYFQPGPAYSDAPAATPVERGAYLVNVLSHCGECHTPRNRLGAPNRDRFLGGGNAPDGTDVPSLMPTRLKEFSDKDLSEFLTTGTFPDGDIANESMEEVITNTTSRLTPADLAAMIAYLRTVPPVPEGSK